MSGGTPLPSSAPAPNPRRRLVGVVVPAHNEAANLPLLHARLRAVAAASPEFDFRFVFVNDGSQDETWTTIGRLAAADPDCHGIDLSRNFGKEIALTAGVFACTDADAVVTLDADLQHPPELISELLRYWQQGAEIVATIRTRTEREPLLRRIGSRAYYWLLGSISTLDTRSQTTDFRLYDRKVVAAFCQATERARMFRGIMDWLGFRKVYVEFAAPERNAGAARYTYRKLLRLASDSLTSFSLLPLKLTGYLGVLITVFSAVLLAVMLVTKFIVGSGFFSPLAIIVVANTFLIGIVLMAIGLVALYIGQIHTEVINRPLFVVRERVGGDAPQAPRAE